MSVTGDVYAPAVTTLQAALATAAPDHAGVDPGRQTDLVQVEAPTYEQARQQLEEQVPEGWRVLWVRTV